MGETHSKLSQEKIKNSGVLNNKIIFATCSMQGHTSELQDTYIYNEIRKNPINTYFSSKENNDNFIYIETDDIKEPEKPQELNSKKQISNDSNNIKKKESKESLVFFNDSFLKKVSSKDKEKETNTTKITSFDEIKTRDELENLIMNHKIKCKNIVLESSEIKNTNDNILSVILGTTNPESKFIEDETQIISNLQDKSHNTTSNNKVINKKDLSDLPMILQHSKETESITSKDNKKNKGLNYLKSDSKEDKIEEKEERNKKNINNSDEEVVVYTKNFNYKEEYESFYLFGLFDGHGGLEISNFVKNNFLNTLLNSKNFLNENYLLSLVEVFLKLDSEMVTENGIKEINKISKLQKEKLKEIEKEKQESFTSKKNQVNLNDSFDEIELTEKELNEIDEFKKIFDPRGNEECISAIFMGTTATVCIIKEDELFNYRNEKVNFLNIRTNNSKVVDTPFEDNNKAEYCNYIAYFANVGDTRAVISVKNKPKQISISHEPFLLEEQSRIYKAGGEIVNSKVNDYLKITRSLGDFEYKSNTALTIENQILIATPDVQSVRIARDADFLILATNSIFEVLKMEDCIEFINKRISKININKQIIKSLKEEEITLENFKVDSLEDMEKKQEKDEKINLAEKAKEYLSVIEELFDYILSLQMSQENETDYFRQNVNPKDSNTKNLKNNKRDEVRNERKKISSLDNMSIIFIKPIFEINS